MTIEQELKLYKTDGMFALYFALNRKLNEVSSNLNSFELDLTADDKTFERFIKLAAALKETADTVNWLRINYLKMDEDEAKQVEKKGIPLLEQLVKNTKDDKK